MMTIDSFLPDDRARAIDLLKRIMDPAHEMSFAEIAKAFEVPFVRENLHEISSADVFGESSAAAPEAPVNQDIERENDEDEPIAAQVVPTLEDAVYSAVEGKGAGGITIKEAIATVRAVLPTANEYNVTNMLNRSAARGSFRTYGKRPKRFLLNANNKRAARRKSQA